VSKFTAGDSVGSHQLSVPCKYLFCFQLNETAEHLPNLLQKKVSSWLQNSARSSAQFHTYHRLILEHSCSYAAGTSRNAGTTRSSGMIGLHWQALWQRARERQTCGESVYREKIGKQQMLGALSLLPQCKPELVLSLNRVLLCISNILPRGPLTSI